MMNKIKNTLIRFMQGRYGTDTLNNFLLFTAIAIAFVNLFIKTPFLTILSDLILILTLFRMFSRNVWKRRQENMKFMDTTKPVRSWFSIRRKNLTDKEHRYYSCPHCHQFVRVPRGRGKIEITCPRCKTTFERKS